MFKKLVENLKQGSNDKELNTSLKLFEEKLTEINELESIKKAKEIIKQAKVRSNLKFIAKILILGGCIKAKRGYFN